MTDTPVVSVLADGWHIEVVNSSTEYHHYREPYGIYVDGVNVQIINFVTGKLRTVKCGTQFEALLNASIMSYVPEQVLNGEIEL